MKLNQIKTLLCVEPGAPIPTVISNEYKLTLLYYYNKETESDSLGYTTIIERSTEDMGIASIKFINHLMYKFGYPNVEALEGHPYYSYGLEPYKIFEVIESDWISAIEKMNRIHPFHDPQKIKSYKHFVIVFNDSCFECIAMALELNFTKHLSMQKALEQMTADFI